MMLNLLLWIFALLGLLAVAIRGYDIAIGFNRWQRRIHIGRWDDMSAWESALEIRGRCWLKRMPIVPKLDNERLILIDKIRGQYSNTTIQSWQRGGLLMGLSLHGSGGYVEHFIDCHGRWLQTPENVDFALLAYAIMGIGRTEIDVDNAMKQIYVLIQSVRGKNATVPYRRGMSDIRFVDTIGFICPFLVRYGMRYDVPEAVALAFEQIKEYDKMLLEGEANFPPHAIDRFRHLPLGVYDWGRGLGWYILGVVESHRNLPESDFKAYLGVRIIKMAEQLLRFQKPSGGWGSSVFIADSPVEGSVTSLAGLLMLEAYTITGDKIYLRGAQGAIRQLMAVTQRNGALDMCQGDTKGIGNYSTRFGYMPFAQGMALLLTKRYRDADA